MGQESAGVIETRHEKTAHRDLPDVRKDEGGGKPALNVSARRSEIDDIRSDLGAYITELDRRRHEAFDVRLQVKKHKGLAITVGAILIALTAGLVAYWANGRMKRPPTVRLGRAELLEEKDSKGSRVSKAAVGVLTAAVMGAVKGAAQRAANGRSVLLARASHEMAASSARVRS